MLHCDKELYDAILKANWDKDRIHRLLLIGNSLTDYLDRNPSRALKDAVPHLFRIAPHLESQPLSPSRTWPTAFNNTCVQVYRKMKNAPSNANPLSHERDEGSEDSEDIFANGDPPLDDDATPTANPQHPPHHGPVHEPTSDTNATPS